MSKSEKLKKSDNFRSYLYFKVLGLYIALFKYMSTFFLKANDELNVTVTISLIMQK